MIDPETKQAVRKLQMEVKENAPIVLRGLAAEGKRLARSFYSAVVRGYKSLISRAKDWEARTGAGRTLVALLSRVRLRSPIYKVK